MNKNNLRNLINNEEHEIWTKLAEQLLEIDSGVVVFLDVEKDIEDKEGIVSIGFAHYPMNDHDIILHGDTCSPFVYYKDDFVDAYLDVGEIAKLALANWQYGFCDGAVQLNLQDMSLHGVSLSTGTLENPKNNFVELYRLKQTSEFDLCSDCTDLVCNNEEELLNDVCRPDFLEDEIYINHLDDMFDEIPYGVFVEFVANQIYDYVYSRIN